MRLCLLPVRITRTRRCRSGFYLIVNGSRIWFKARADALKGLRGWLDLQRVEVVSVRAYAARKKVRGKRP